MSYKILSIGVACAVLTACQTLPNTSNINGVEKSQENSKQLLNHALKRAIYQQQTWVSEHQLYLKNTPKTVEATDELTACQETHDKRFVEQLTADNLVKFADVASLSEEKQAVYQAIKQDYLDCYANYEQNLPDHLSAEAKSSDTEQDFLVDSLSDKQDEWQHQMNDVMKIMGFSTAQIDSINQFLLKSGKLTITGNYQPLAGEMSLMFDAGFENKNLKYHYRLPMVINAKNQNLYVKPDIFMPTIALYLDNQLGVSWQDKWYKIRLNQDENLPKDMQLKAWIFALKQSFDDLPSSQFTTIDSRLLLPNIAHASQKIAKNGTVVKWQQTAKEQDNLYQDVLENYIQAMDKDIEKTSDSHKTAWQASKAKLQEKLENRLAIEPDENNRLAGQIVYFVLANGELKQIFTQHKATTRSQNYQFNSFVTFNPDESLLNPINQPKTLAKLQKTIDDSETGNVLDAQTEIERLKKLDDSRRLFGTEPEWFKYFNKISKADDDDDD